MPEDVRVLLARGIAAVKSGSQENREEARQQALQIGSDYEKKNSLGGHRYRDFVMNTAGLVVNSYKLVLLPIWLGCYQYKDETFPVEVNGQTGTVAGQVPRSRLQRALATLLRSQ